MSLLEELQSIDLSGIVNARGSISAAVSGPELQALLNDGAAQTALAGLGTAMQAAREGLDSPAALVAPLIEAAGALAGNFDHSRLPLAPYLGAVRAGAGLVASFFDGVDDDPLSFGSKAGFSLSGTFGALQEVVAKNAPLNTPGLGQLRYLIDIAERGVPGEPRTVAMLALDMLLPFPRSNVEAMRGGLTVVTEAVGQMALPRGRTAGLVAALNAVSAASATGDVAAVDRALEQVERVRTNTVAAIRDDALALVARLDQLQLDRVLAPVATASGALRTATAGVLEALDELRTLLALFRSRIDNFDPATLTARLPELLNTVEAFAREHLVAPIDAQIARLQAWVRSLLAELHLRAYRQDITDFILGIARAIREADLDRYAEAARAALHEVQAALDPARLTAEVQQALAAAKAVIDAALNRVLASLTSIKAEIDAVAGEAEAILNRAAQALASFRLAVEAATAALDGLGVEAATQQVVDTLRQLRETAEALLSVAPLPESMRPTIEQLIEELRSLDFEVVFAPVRAAVAEFQISDEVAGTIRASLSAVAGILDNLIPRELIAGLEAEIEAALETLRGFNPASLLSGVTGYLNEAAEFVEGLNPEPLVAEIRGPFQTALDTLDAVHPRKLLIPVIEAYDSVMEKIKLPSPIKAAGRVAEAINSTGEGLASSLLQPLTQLAPAGSTELPARTAPAGTDSPAADATSAPPGTTPNANAAVSPPAFMSEVASFRPGDIVRVMAFLPNRLREILAGLEASQVGETLRLIDSFTGGLARDLRALQAQLWQIEDDLGTWLEAELRPLGQAQLRAQLAMRASFTSDGVSLDARLRAVAQAGPGAMRLALGPSTQMARQRARAAVTVGSRYGDALERAALALERCTLTGLVGDLDRFIAALDPEPLAAEIDALMAAVINKTPALMEQFGEALEEAIRRLKALFDEVNPINQAEKLTRVLDVVREELDLLDPRRLADELAEVHAAIREVLAAYDPGVFAHELGVIVQNIAGGLRALDPAALLGDLSLFDDLADRLEAIVPTQALAGVGESLAAVGLQLREIDPQALLEALERLAPELVEAFEVAVETIRQETVALLESLRYAAAHASASATVEVGA